MKTLENYSASDWRTHQKEYAETVLAAALSDNPVRVGLEGPCGCGKSIGYLRPLLAPGTPPSVVLTTTRQHLHQLEETLERYWPGSEQWAILRGRDFYGCCSNQERPDPDVDADPAAAWLPGKCPLGDRCRYRLAVVAAGRAQVVVMCTIGALYRKRFWAGLPEPGTLATDAQRELHAARIATIERQVYVLDEAHEYLRVRREFETARLAVKPRTWPKPVLDRAVRERQKGPYQSSTVLLPRASALRAELLEHFSSEELRLSDVPEPTRQQTAQLEAAQARIALLTDLADDPKMDPVLYLQWDGVKTHLVKEPIFAHIGEQLAPIEIFTSATLADVARLLKIEPQHLEVFPAIFDPANLIPQPMEDNAQGSMRNVALGADVLRSIYESEGRPTTIVLFLSKKAAHEAAGALARQPGVFVQGLTRTDDDEQTLGALVGEVKANAAAGGAPFLVCYGGWVGTDIPGDKWLVIGQAPKTPLPPYLEERQNRRLGRGWNDPEKIILDRLQLAQGLGRALRTPEDQACVIWPDNRSFRDLGLDPATGKLR